MSNQQYFAPHTLGALSSDLARLTPHGKIIAGGTDLILQLNGRQIEPDALLYLGALPEAASITREQDRIRIGAMADMTSLARSPLLADSALAQAAAHVGSVQIRNKATIGGNIANASPAGDLIVPLWLLGAEAQVAGPGGVRYVPIDKLMAGIGKTTLAYNEAILSFSFKMHGKHVETGYRKLGSRSEVTISRVGIAALIEWNGEIVRRAELVLGAVAPTPVRAAAAENALTGSCLEPSAVTKAGELLSDFILEINNRPNRIYKARAAKGVLEDLLAQFKK